MLLDMGVLPVSEIQSLDAHIENGIDEGDLIVGSVISGNEISKAEFTEGQSKYLASPPLVVAYALWDS